MDRKSPLKLVELMSCAITLGAPIVASGIVSADNVNEVQNVSYQKQSTKIAFDPNDALTKQALNKARQDGAIKSVALVTLKDGKTSSVNMNNENGVYVATLQGNQKGTKYQFAITYQDGKTVKINNPYADNKLDTQFSVIGSKGVNPAVKTTNMTTVAPNGQMLEMKGTTRDGDSQTVTVNFHLYYLNKDTKAKVGDVVIPLQIKSQLYSHLTENNGAINTEMVEALLAKSTVAAHCPNGYELIDPFSKGNSDNSDESNANRIPPINILTTPTQMGANNTIECDYEVVPAPAQSSSSSSSSSSAQQVQAPAASSSSASSAQPATVVSSSSSSQAVTDNGHSSNQPANNPNDVNHGPVATSSSSSSSSSSASVSVVSSSKVSVSSSSVAATPSKSSSSASDTQNHNQPAVVEKPTATSVSSSSSSSSNSDSKSSSSDSDKKQSESSSANAKSENNGSQSEQHNTAAVTQGATNSGETAENNGKGNNNFFGKSNGTTGEKQQAAVTKKADNGNNGGNAGNTGATNDDNGNTNSNSASDSSSSSSSSSSVSSSSSSVAGNDNEKSMPQTGEMILRGLGILGGAALACVGGYYGFQAYKKKQISNQK